MKLTRMQDGYIMRLSAADTYSWAHKPGGDWPCAVLSGDRVLVVVDANGLCDISVNGKTPRFEIPENELTALVADHLPKDLRQYWPTWETAQ